MSSKFVRGVIVCTVCGKRTQETGSGESSLLMCVRCIVAMEWLLSVEEGSCTLEQVPQEHRAKVKKMLK